MQEAHGASAYPPARHGGHPPERPRIPHHSRARARPRLGAVRCVHERVRAHPTGTRGDRRQSRELARPDHPPVGHAAEARGTRDGGIMAHAGRRRGDARVRSARDPAPARGRRHEGPQARAHSSQRGPPADRVPGRRHQPRRHAASVPPRRRAAGRADATRPSCRSPSSARAMPCRSTASCPAADGSPCASARRFPCPAPHPRSSTASPRRPPRRSASSSPRTSRSADDAVRGATEGSPADTAARVIRAPLDAAARRETPHALDDRAPG